MQGWSPDFIPKLAGDALEAGLIDRLQPVAGADAMACARDLAAREGIFCGTSGGATFAAALKVAENAPEGATILAMIPDTGERYLSTPLFADVAETMTEEEMEIAASTPRYRFDAPSSAPAPAGTGPAVVTAEAEALVDRFISDPDEPVVMFALEWCEFCWSVRKLFAAAGIRYRSVDLDSAAYQKENLGGDIRAVLLKKIGTPTIPQIFVGGHHVGGATETFDAYGDGSLAEKLAELGAEPVTQGLDAYGFLPGWLHPR
jgi:cysteine synthase A